MISDVGLVEVEPKADAFGEPFPLLHVAPDARLAFMNERLDAVRLDLFLRVDAQFLADLDLDRQAVRIPAGLAFTKESAHGAIAREEIFDGPGEAVARVRHPVGGGGAFVEDEFRPAGALLQRFVVNFMLFPKSADFGFERGKIHAAVDGTEHAKITLPRRNGGAGTDGGGDATAKPLSLPACANLAYPQTVAEVCHVSACATHKASQRVPVSTCATGKRSLPVLG